MEFRETVKKSAAQRLLFLPHAIRQMSRPERTISTADVRGVVECGEIVEDYPEDVRGRSCLMLGQGKDGRPLHVVCSPKDDYLAIITSYVPDAKQWTNNYRTRVEK